jgi:hypothetical protein
MKRLFLVGMLMSMLAGCATATPAPPGPATAWGYRLNADAANLPGLATMFFSETKEECEARFAKLKAAAASAVRNLTSCRQVAVIPASSGGWYASASSDSMFGRPTVRFATLAPDDCERLRQRGFIIIHSPTPCVPVTLVTAVWAYRVDSEAGHVIGFSEVKEGCEVTLAKEKRVVPRPPRTFTFTFTDCRPMAFIPGGGSGW